MDFALAALAEKTETDAEWVRRLLKAEAEDFRDNPLLLLFQNSEGILNGAKSVKVC